MKKVLILLSAVSLLSVVSCSSDDGGSSSTSDDVLVKRVAFQYPGDAISDEITYSYNGNKLVKGVYLDGAEEKYYYTGDRITKIEYIFDGVVEAQDIFTYNSSGMLTEAKYIEDVYEERSTFVMVDANTITETYYSGTSTTTPDWTATLTLANGEITQKAQNGFSTYTYTYDTKNSPFKNVTGWGAIAYASAGDHELEGSMRNIASIHDDTDNTNYTTNTYTYNAADYPMTVSSVAIFDSSLPTQTETMTAQYFYE